MKQEKKIVIAIFGMLWFFGLARVFGQTNFPVPPATLNVSGAGILYAMFGQVCNNPSSLLVIGTLCVFAWLMDDLPFVNSRYIKHMTVILGASIFRFFSLESAVPDYFPHPQAVFVCNGLICGMLAFVAHRWFICRVILFFRSKSNAFPDSLKPVQLKPTNPNQP